MKILHVTFDMRIGGTEQVIRNLIEAATGTGQSMSIFCIEEPLGPWGVTLRDHGVPIYSVHRRPGFDWQVLRHLRRCLREHRFDVLHCHQYTPWVYGALAALGSGARVLFTEHGRFYPDRSSPKRRFVNPLLARMTQHMTAISEATKQALVDYEHLSANRIEVIYNGIQGLRAQPEAARALRDELGIPADAIVLGTIARLDPIKNHRMMLNAFARALTAHPDCFLLLIGDGEERRNIEGLIAELAIGHRVITPGYLPDPTKWLDAMDIFLLSSFSEGTSMTLLEAMSLSKPCIVTDVGGNPEIVAHGATGQVTPNDETQAFTDAITMLIEAPQLREEMGRAARARFDMQFRHELMLDKFTALYDSVR